MFRDNGPETIGINYNKQMAKKMLSENSALPIGNTVRKPL